MVLRYLVLHWYHDHIAIVPPNKHLYLLCKPMYASLQLAQQEEPWLLAALCTRAEESRLLVMIREIILMIRAGCGCGGCMAVWRASQTCETPQFFIYFVYPSTNDVG